MAGTHSHGVLLGTAHKRIHRKHMFWGFAFLKLQRDIVNVKKPAYPQLMK
jgi:hypothetical protein